MSAPDPQPDPLTRDQLASEYFARLPFTPYPVQEEALLAWFTAQQGVLVCAPTGTGKTLIAEAAVYEALRTGRIAYYTTPLIALTEQKFEELRKRAQQWGFSPDQVGLVTGNRRVHPGAHVLVVVAEILLNRLLTPQSFDFGFVENVVMDEFHSFNDPQRGIVWEMSLSMLPRHVRTLLLSATVGNAYEFAAWLRQAHGRDLQLVQSTERRVPLTYHWVPDQYLQDELERLAQGSEAERFTPALVFCFNRDECWNVGDQLRGKRLIDSGRQALLEYELRKVDLSEGAGPKLRALLQRGVGVHHAGVMPKYRRIVEDLFEKKLLAVVVCTETLAAGINLPARTVVIPSLTKGPPDKKKLIDPSNAHQMFGRAGRPQFDTHGHVFALAHEDDVKLLRWREQYDRLPENPKDLHLRRAKKALEKKMPRRRPGELYWTEAQFQALVKAPPGKLWSAGRLPWRLLTHVLERTADVLVIREVVAKRLMPPKLLEAGQRQLDRMLLSLWRGGYVKLEPEPPRSLTEDLPPTPGQGHSEPEPSGRPSTTTLFGQPLSSKAKDVVPAAGRSSTSSASPASPSSIYRVERAIATETLHQLNLFRGVNPLYGVFLAHQLEFADTEERLQAWESVLDLPGSVARSVRVPNLQEMPRGLLATSQLDERLLRLGLATQEELVGSDPDEYYANPEDRVWPLKFAEKLHRLFQHDFPDVDDVVCQPVWAAGEILRFGGSFQKFILHRRLQRQEGLIFRHLLRLILLIAEFRYVKPVSVPPEQWSEELRVIQDQFVEVCKRIDPTSTEKTLEEVSHLEDAELLHASIME